MPRTKILFKESDPLIGRLCGEALAKQPDFEVVACVQTWQAAVYHAREWSIDVLVTNIDIHSRELLDSVEAIRALCPLVAVLFSSGFDEPYSFEFALRTRPRGYLCKPFRIERLVEAIRAVAAGGVYFSEVVRPWIVMGPNGPEFRAKP